MEDPYLEVVLRVGAADPALSLAVDVQAVLDEELEHVVSGLAPLFFVAGNQVLPQLRVTHERIVVAPENNSI